MRRRRFLQSLFSGAAFYAARDSLQSSSPQIALTLDDPAVGLSSFMHWQEANERFLEALRVRKLKAALFICGMRIDSPEGGRLLQGWNDAGHMLGNHSYSHLNFNAPRISYDRFVEDFLRNEPLLSPFPKSTKIFRFPSLKEGDTVEKRDGFRRFLDDHGYATGHVTIDTSDWYIDQCMVARLKISPSAPKEAYRDYLITHLLDRASFYRNLALAVVGREIPHTILMHYRTLNALYLPDVMSAFEKNGWRWVDAKQAFQDPIFRSHPRTMPAGESLVWALASEDGHYSQRLRYPGEDDAYEQPRMKALGLL